MKEFFQSPKIKIFLSVLLVLIMLSVFTRNVENNVISATFNTLTYGMSKVTAAATSDNSGNKSYDELKKENEELKELLEKERELYYGDDDFAEDDWGRE